jgi:hypothetical protein
MSKKELMISPETRVQIRRYFYAEHWKIGTIARELNVHPNAVRNAIESDRFNRTEPMRASITDPYMEFVRQTLDQHPRLRATRIHQMIRDRGYTGSIIQLRRAVARLRPIARARTSPRGDGTTGRSAAKTKGCGSSSCERPSSMPSAAGCRPTLARTLHAWPCRSQLMRGAIFTKTQ